MIIQRKNLHFNSIQIARWKWRSIPNNRISTIIIEHLDFLLVSVTAIIGSRITSLTWYPWNCLSSAQCPAGDMTSWRCHQTWPCHVMQHVCLSGYVLVLNDTNWTIFSSYPGQHVMKLCRVLGTSVGTMWSSSWQVQSVCVYCSCIMIIRLYCYQPEGLTSGIR